MGVTARQTVPKLALPVSARHTLPPAPRADVVVASSGRASIQQPASASSARHVVRSLSPPVSPPHNLYRTFEHPQSPRLGHDNVRVPTQTLPPRRTDGIGSPSQAQKPRMRIRYRTDVDRIWDMVSEERINDAIDEYVDTVHMP